MYQKCPKCIGEGRVYNPLSTATYDICPVCKGRMVINVLTGLPPLPVAINLIEL